MSSPVALLAQATGIPLTVTSAKMLRGSRHFSVDFGLGLKTKLKATILQGWSDATRAGVVMEVKGDIALYLHAEDKQVRALLLRGNDLEVEYLDGVFSPLSWDDAEKILSPITVQTFTLPL